MIFETLIHFLLYLSVDSGIKHHKPKQDYIYGTMLLIYINFIHVLNKFFILSNLIKFQILLRNA
jgi:hypothetical protein